MDDLLHRRLLTPEQHVAAVAALAPLPAAPAAQPAQPVPAPANA